MVEATGPPAEPSHVQPRRLGRVFFAALARETAEDRAAFLEQTCRHDPETRREIERLVAAHARVRDFLEKPPPEVAAAAQQLPATEPSATELDFLTAPTRPGSLGRLAHYPAGWWSKKVKGMPEKP
jgi:hypothetical protein